VSDPKLIEACEKLESRFKDWWKERRKQGTLLAGELSKQLALFLKDHPEYEQFKDDIEPYYVTVPGSYIEGNQCICGDCSWVMPSAKVRDVKVRPFDWNQYRRLALEPHDFGKLKGKSINPSNGPDLTKGAISPLKDFKLVFDPVIQVG
jgi:hypothetical protein